MATPIEDSFFTISKKAEGEFKDKGSRFIAIAYPFDNIDLLKTYLIETKTIHPKARHFCYAYKIGMDSENSRSNDDGEPSGSAGKPILNAILSKNLSNILIIVIRYFGGTLLGVPGLINAYKSASLEAISNSEIENRFVHNTFIFKYDFEKTNEIMRILKENNLKILHQSYSEKCEITIQIRQSLSDNIIEKIKNLRFVEIAKS